MSSLLCCVAPVGNRLALVSVQSACNAVSGAGADLMSGILRFLAPRFGLGLTKRGLANSLRDRI